MKIKNCLLAFFIFFPFISCNTQNKVEDSKGKLVIDMDKAKMNPDSIFTASMLFKGIKLIPLETNESCLIGSITKITVFEQFIFVMDHVVAKSLYVFDKEGRFIRKIGSVGSGPGEYVEIRDFTIDRVNKTVYLYDGRLQRINIYDLATGKFIRYVSLERNTSNVTSNGHIEHIGGKLYSDAAFREHTVKNFLLFTIDELSGKENNNFLNVIEYNKGISNTNANRNPYVPFYMRENGDAIFVQPFMNHLIEITNDGVFSYIEFKGKNFLTSDEAKRTNELFNYKSTAEVRNINKYTRLVSYFEKGDRILIDMAKGMQLHRILIHKKTKEVTIFERGRDDLLYSEDKNPGKMPSYGCFDANGVYFYTGSFSSNGVTEFQSFARSGALSPSIIGLDNLMKLDEEDNPILFYYEFKE